MLALARGAVALPAPPAAAAAAASPHGRESPPPPPSLGEDALRRDAAAHLTWRGFEGEHEGRPPRAAASTAAAAAARRNRRAMRLRQGWPRVGFRTLRSVRTADVHTLVVASGHCGTPAGQA